MNIAKIIAGDLEWQAMQLAREQARIQTIGELPLIVILISLVILLLLIIYYVVQKILHK